MIVVIASNNYGSSAYNVPGTLQVPCVPYLFNLHTGFMK